jgi:hypothetical protein
MYRRKPTADSERHRAGHRLALTAASPDERRPARVGLTA